MFQRMTNHITINASLDLTDYTDVTVFIRQRSVELSYAGTVNGTEITAVIPKADALKLTDRVAELQVCATDSNGVPIASNPIEVDVKALLWEAGYGS